MNQSPPLDEGIDLDNFNKEEEIGSFQGIDTHGFQVLVRLYIPPKKIGSVYIPDTAHEDYQFRACTGLVVQKGPESYQDERFTGGWCAVGDWIVFPRHEGILVKINGKPCQFLNDASVLAKVDDPRRIVR